MILANGPLLLIITLFFLLLVPYELFSSVQLSYLLHPFHQLDPAFLSRDWFVTQTTSPHPFFGLLVRFFQMHGILPAAFFGLYAAQMFLLVGGIFHLSRLFSEDFRAPVLICWLLLFYFSDGLGQSTLYSGFVQPTDLAMPFFLFALIALFQNKFIPAFGFLGVSGLFHIHLGLGGLLVILFFCFFRRETLDFKQIGAGFLLFLVCFSLNLIPIMKNFSLFDSSGNSELLKVFFNFRSPYHYRPSTFESAHVFRVIFPLFFLGFIKNKDKKRPFSEAMLFVTIVTSLCVLAAVSTELFYWPSIAKLFLFRLSPSLLLIGLLFISIALIGKCGSKNLADHLIAGTTITLLYLEKDSRLFIPLGLYLSVTWYWATLRDRKAFPLRSNFMLFVLWVPFIISFLVTRRGADLVLNGLLASFAVLFLKMNPKGLAGRLFWVFLFLGAPALVLHRFHPERVQFHQLNFAPSPSIQKESPEFYDALIWVRNHTEKEALLLTPPYLNGARFFAQRAIVADFQVHPFTLKGLAEWKARLERITGSSGLEKWDPIKNSNSQQDYLRRGYLNLRVNEIEQISREYGVDYFLTESSIGEKEELIRGEGLPVFSNHSFLIFRIKKNSL